MNSLLIEMRPEYGERSRINTEMHDRYYNTAFNCLRVAFPSATADAIVDATRYSIGEWFSSAPQEVFVCGNKSRNWIIQVARRSLIHELRREKRFTMLPDSDHDENDSQSQTPPGLVDDSSSTVISALLVEGLLQRLPLAAAEAMRMHVIEGFTVKEIAEIQHCSPNTVKKRLKRGYAKLRDIVRKDECIW